jgi:2,3-bisphosphoglycerate-independent phosphoglycerate mutase
MSKKPVMLMILDGWGYRKETADNAVAQGKTPNFDRLMATCPHGLLYTSGRVVGLPEGQMGNSEVGHLNIGAGRVVMQELPRIDAAIEDGSLAQNPVLIKLVDTLRASHGTCHLLGLISPGGVHSHQDQAVALAKIITAAGIPVVIHGLLDGRDTPPQSAAEYIKAFEAALPKGAVIGTLIGRYYGMDRDKRWERVAQSYNLIVSAEGKHFETAEAAIAASYAENIGDEFVQAISLQDYTGVKDDDALLCFNFRADRVREILAALLDPDFDGFRRETLPKFVSAVGMTPYSDALEPLMESLFLPQPMQDLLSEVVAAAGKTQMHMAETEKYPHVTFFFNGGRETPFEGEDRIMVPSPKVATYDLQPEMSAPELTDKAVAAINSGKYDMFILNFANPDMVGHTGFLDAAIKAVETVDAGLGRIADAIAAQHGALLVTADHGNCEMMRDPETGEPHTAHTTNPVPVFCLGAPAGAKLHNGILADLAPTVLALMGLPQPAAMTGKNLLEAAA